MYHAKTKVIHMGNNSYKDHIIELTSDNTFTATGA